MQARATAKVKIPISPEILATIKVYQRGLQFCVDEAWQKGIKNNVRLHPFVYKSLRSLGLQSQLAIACIKQACGIVKKAKSKPIINRCSMRYNFPRSASFKGNILSLATLEKRIKFPFSIPKCYQQYFTADWKICESLLRFDRKQRCFFLFTFSKEVDAKSSDLHRVLGIDLGVNNLAVTSDGRFFNSSKVKQIKRKFKHLRSVLQAKGTRSSKRLLRKLSGREQRFMAWVNHNISKNIIARFDGDKIVMEDLKGIRKQWRGKRMNYWISNWSFFQLQSFIQYKAERRGMEVSRVKPDYTSQLCHTCGSLGSRISACFACVHCGYSSYSADLNAALNLAHPMLGERQAAVTRPHSSCDDTGNPVSGLLVEHRAENPCL